MFAIELKLNRDAYWETHTHGSILLPNGPTIRTLEDTVREVEGERVSAWKIPSKTAIPVGRYKLVIDYSTRFARPMPHLLNVPGFTGVRIHAGNTAEDTEGCIVTGLRRQGDHVLESRAAFELFFDWLKTTLAVRQVYMTVS